MRVLVRLGSIVAALMFGLISISASAEVVEIVLKDKLDGDLNDYCFDIVGGGQNINPADGLQTHTCYSYRGALGADQAIDTSSLENGKILLIEYDVCATIKSHEVGATLDLELCDGSDSQQFLMAESGTISPASAPGMCMTAGKDTALGRGGTSRHQIKSLTLQVCSEEEASYQEWYTRTQAEYDAAQAE